MQIPKKSLFNRLAPYFLAYPWHLTATLIFLLLAKFSNLGVPLLLKQVVNSFNNPLFIPIWLIIAYGSFRFLAYVFDEACSWIFAHVTERTLQAISLDVFEHLHRLSISFHLNRQGGRLHREIDRGTRGIRSLVSYSLYRILPTIVEISIVMTWLISQYRLWYSIVVFIALILYISYTFAITEWRTAFRIRMNELDNQVSQNTYEALLNYETIKYFGNEKLESSRYGKQLNELSTATIKNDRTLSALDFGQQLIIAISLITVLLLGAFDLKNKAITLGDWVLINSLMLQLYIPLVFLGMMYREIRQALTDTTRLFDILDEKIEIHDIDNPITLATSSPNIEFKNIHFSYDSKREIIKGINFTVPAGTTTALVGHSGCGKSTLTKLLFRFYDIQQGEILINGINIKNISQESLRQHMAVVAQDTVLFNESLEYNIKYGRPNATKEEYIHAVKAADIDIFANQLSNGYATVVGERGLKLSGGEKQRVAIARALLKQAPILILDEATSALDTKTEYAIQESLYQLSLNRTSLIIAHRLSTITHAQQIIVLDKGSIVEKGTHTELLEQNGIYAHMWAVQSKKKR